MAGKQKTKPYNTQLQILAMKSIYPAFGVARRTQNEIEFIGQLQVKPELPIYTVSITYRGEIRPSVKIISPPIVEGAKHVYPDGTLCLYHPEDYQWRREKLVAIDIVPWIASWIYFYEVWLQTNIWYGPEASHNTQKN